MGERIVPLPLMQPLNTMFLHFFVARDELCLAAMNEILRITFTALPQLQYVCLAVPSHTKLGMYVCGPSTAIQSVHTCCVLVTKWSCEVRVSANSVPTSTPPPHMHLLPISCDRSCVSALLLGCTEEHSQLPAAQQPQAKGGQASQALSFPFHSGSKSGGQ